MERHIYVSAGGEGGAEVIHALLVYEKQPSPHFARDPATPCTSLILILARYARWNARQIDRFGGPLGPVLHFQGYYYEIWRFLSVIEARAKGIGLRCKLLLLVVN